MRLVQVCLVLTTLHPDRQIYDTDNNVAYTMLGYSTGSKLADNLEQYDLAFCVVVATINCFLAAHDVKK